MRIPLHRPSRGPRDRATPDNPPSTRPRLTAARWRRFLSYYRPHRGLLCADLACAVLIAATALALPLCANHVLGRLAAAPDAAALFDELLFVGVGMLLLLAVQAACTLFVDYQGHVMGARMEGALRRELFAHYQSLSFSFHDRHRTGQLMSRLTNDLLALSELYHHGPEDLAIAVLKFSGAVLVLLHLDLPLTLAIVASLPLAVAYALFFNARLRAALTSSKERIAAINERALDALAGVRVVKAFGNEALEAQRFEAENARFLATRRHGYRAEALFSIGLSTYAQLVTLFVIVAGSVRIVAASLSVADLLTFLLCVAILVDPIARAANFARLWQEGMTGFARFMEVLETPPDIVDVPGATELANVQGSIAFRDVAFRYPGVERFALRGVSLDIAAGEFVALVGYSGVGKSTLCALVPRFHDVTAGSVTIDGHDVRSLTQASLRAAIGVVHQDVYLFAGSVADNLAYARPGATRAEIERAARRAHAHDFIAALPQGYDTEVGERGVRLSGGQRQRLTIARAFLRDPPILILDEATSALDGDSERAVQRALIEIAKGRTMLVIAHRLSTIRHADRIVLLTEDGIAEQGTHEALMRARGLYFGLHDAGASL